MIGKGTMQYLQCFSLLVSILPRGQRKWSTKERRNGSAYTPCAQLMPPLSLFHCLACLVARHCEPVRLWWRSCCQSCIDHTMCNSVPRDSKIFRYEEKAWPACAVVRVTMWVPCWLLEGNYAPLFFCLVQCFTIMPWCHAVTTLRSLFRSVGLCLF